MDLTSSSNRVCKKYQFYTILEISVIIINIQINRKVSDEDLLRTRYSCDVNAYFIVSL